MATHLSLNNMVMIYNDDDEDKDIVFDYVINDKQH